MSLQLWSINRWLRYFGVRVFIQVGDGTPTRIGMMFAGFPGSARWYRWEANRQKGASL